jgi:fused signal recognition particle receptor
VDIAVAILVGLLVLLAVAFVVLRRRRGAGGAGTSSGAAATTASGTDVVTAAEPSSVPTPPATTVSVMSVDTAAEPSSVLTPPAVTLGGRIGALFKRGVDEGTWGRFEDTLLKADVGPRAASDLVSRVRARYQPGSDPSGLLFEEVVAVLGPDEPLHLAADRLGVVMVVGVNGSGKTTTIGKLARLLAEDGRRVSLAASDTFRAAAGEQLEVWAERAGAHLVSQARGADPGAVAFDAVKAAQARGSDVLIVDTAGRLHTKTPLMDELAKVKRVIGKAGAEVDETLLVLDATTGQNGVAQARAFVDAVDVSGVVLAKMDGSARGGVVLAVREELGVPVRFVGVGERPGDLLPFVGRDFAEGLLRA